MGIGEVLMQLCSDVYIIEEFSSFLMSHLMQVFGESFEAEISTKMFPREGIFFANGYHWFLQ